MPEHTYQSAAAEGNQPREGVDDLIFRADPDWQTSDR